MTPADAGAAAHVFVRNIDGPDLTSDDRHHLERVLRLRAGALITVSDGAGRWRVVRFGAPLELLGPVETATRPVPSITIGLALVKGERPELAVQKLTELGVDRIVLFTAARSVVRWDGDRARKHEERLRAIARAAGMQSRRAYLPEVVVGTPFAELVAAPGAAIAERGGAPPSLAYPTVLVGPEGGWSDAERKAANATVAVNDAVLRAETAAITTGALLTSLRGRIVTPKPADHHAG